MFIGSSKNFTLHNPESSKGRTRGFESLSGGSNPSSGTILITQKLLFSKKVILLKNEHSYYFHF